jgi:hypothetical protein
MGIKNPADPCQAAVISGTPIQQPQTNVCAPGAAVDDPALSQDLDVGVYVKRGNCWLPLLPEIVNWKTGGVLKSAATAGIVKGDVNGHLQGNRSHNFADHPVELLLYTPEGTQYTEYQLIHLRENSHNREFRTVTGGVWHVSGGASRDALPFDATPIGKRLWTVSLPRSLQSGEYGFLPPGAVTSRTSASIGKMYTFRLPGKE